ncbi:MAG TPA: hypothetical protein VH440_04320, partial [Candidatus Limnocylindrales bacterium]
MASGIVYLDVDDEITSAAARIRSSTATKVALVVPYGSRIATSRMNFRLLSREAVVSNRRLSIVSGDAASRALAASAGLPVFASVAEYETTIEGGPGRTEPGDGASAGADRAAAAAATSLAASETVAAVGPAAGLPDTDEEPAEPARPLPPATTRRAIDDTTRMAVPASAAAGAGVAAAATGAIPRPVPETRPRASSPTRAGDADDTDAAPRRRIATPIFVAAGLVALVVIVLAVGGYLLLPSASIAVTPRREPISVELTVSADPEATAVDPATGVVPAVRLDVPVEATDTFTTTGVHVEQTAATGEVTFSNYNPVSSNTVPGGSIVATEGGIRFKTLASVTIPAGTFVLPNVVPSTRRVAVQAVRAGTEGNVPANAIRVVPQGENPDFLKVTNNDPTDGGTRTETPEVTQAEVDKAVADLQSQLQANFDDAIAAGAGAPPDTTLFPATAQLGTVTTEPDPKTLVGQAVPTFDLTLSATGTVIAVDPRPVREIAEQQLDAKVGADHRLVDGSVQIDVGDGTVGEDEAVSFQATASAERVPILDASQLRTLVKGRTKAEAEAALAPFGTAKVTLWPDWVSTVPSLDARLELRIDDTGAAGSPGASSPR